jgi:hypothetical protein
MTSLIGFISNVSLSNWISILAIVISSSSFLYTWNNDKRINEISENNIRASIMPFISLTLDKEIRDSIEGFFLKIGLKNIGNGAVTDVKIIKIDNQNNCIVINGEKKYVRKDLNQNVIMQGGEVSFEIILTMEQMKMVSPYYAGNKFKQAKINFSIEYTDLLGNKYRQCTNEVSLKFNEEKWVFLEPRFIIGKRELVDTNRGPLAKSCCS